MALVSTGLALFLLFRAAHPSVSRPAQASPFSELQEDTVPGRYRWIEGDDLHGLITLRPDHSFIPAKGQQARVHPWEIGRDALLVIFASGVQRFTNIESPGFYISSKSDGRIVRMERE